MNLVEATPEDSSFWASSVGSSTDEEWLDLDLGEVRAVNFMSFEVLNKPFIIDIYFDTLDASDMTVDLSEAVISGPIKQLRLDPQRAAVWEHVMLDLSDEAGNTIFTRFLRVKFTRLQSELREPWNIEVRGLRVGRVS
jgi:hypothetical protein